VLASALPVLAGLTPLRPDADIEEMDAARAVIEAELRSVVNELSTPGGPRGPRVDGLFQILLEQDVIGVDGTAVRGGMLGYLGEVFGLTRGRVNTVSEEQIFTNYLLLTDYVRTLQSSWSTFGDTFGNGSRDLGTMLVLLSNALQVVAESVDELQSALDSVFVGSAEQSVTRFSIANGQETMLVSELLGWVTSFSAEEAPELVQAGGRRAMGAVETTAGNLIELLEDLLAAIGSAASLPAGMRHPRVRHPLEELVTYLRQVVQISADVRTA
jgi:hypothetical protein